MLREKQTDAFPAEKVEATRMWRRIETLSRELRVPDARLHAVIQISCTYGRVKWEIVEQMGRVILVGSSQPPNAEVVTAALSRYDALWAEWRALRKLHPNECATLYVDQEFNDHSGMGAAIEKFRPNEARVADGAN